MSKPQSDKNEYATLTVHKEYVGRVKIHCAVNGLKIIAWVESLIDAGLKKDKTNKNT